MQKNSAQIKRVTLPTATVAPFCLARVGGVSAAALDALALSQTTALLRTATAAEAEMRTLAPSIEDALHQLVSRTEGQRDLCRRALKVKRNIHNQRAWTEMSADIAGVAAELADDSVRMRLSQWQAAAVAREAARNAAANSYEQEVNTAAQTLAASLCSTELQAGIALASPNTLADIQRNQVSPRAEEWKPTSKLARSALAYLTRASLKTSPLSTFTQLAVAPFDGRDNPQPLTHHPSPAIRRNRLHLARALPFAWLQLIARDTELAPALQFEPNAGLYFREPGKIRVLTCEHDFHEAFATRSERIATRQFNPERLPELAALLASQRRIGYDELLALLAVHFAQPQQALVQLLDAQLLRAVLPYTPGETQMLEKLAAVVAESKSARATKIEGLLLEAQQLKERYERADAATRLQLFAALRQTANDIFTALNAPVPTWLQRAGLLYEDVRFAGATITLQQHIERDLQTVAAVLRPQIMRTHLYDAIYQYFVRRFGTDGITEDILGFLQDFREREDFQEIVHRALAEDQRVWREGDTTGWAHLPGGASAVAPTAGIYFQLAAESEAALQRGEYTLVVNEVSSGHGGLVGRFTELLGAEHGQLQERLASWVQQTHGEALLLEMPLIGEWNNLHARLGVTVQTLQWPGEAPTPETPTHRWQDLRLRADAASQTLYFTDQSGQTVAPMYLGLIPTLRLNGVMGLLLTLLDPWMQGPDVGDKKSPLLSNSLVAPSDIEYTPRQVQGHIVLRRARWRFPVTQIPTRNKGESEFDFFARVQRWRIAHNLPEEVFATAERQCVEFDARFRKPVWVHFGSPHALELMRQLIVADTLALSFTEALPNRAQHWVVDVTTNERRVSEMLSLVRWPMPVATTNVAPPSSIRVPRSANDWLYYKIYPVRHDQLNDVLRRIVAPAICTAHATGQMKRWFFLRYHDTRGAHIRLRLQGPASFCATMRDHLDDLITNALPQLQSESRAPLFALDETLLHLPQITRGFVQAVYAPEYEKYGGETGVALAEKLFEVSSELALHTLSLLPAQLARLGLCAMQWMARALLSTPEEQQRFLTNYVWYWSGQNHLGTQQVRARLIQAAHQPLSAAWPGTMSAALQEVSEEYRLAVTVTARALATTKVPVPPTRLCFDYIHVTNNRLGLTALEECYLATLLRQTISSGTKEMV